MRALSIVFVAIFALHLAGAQTYKGVVDPLADDPIYPRPQTKIGRLTSSSKRLSKGRTASIPRPIDGPIETNEQQAAREFAPRRQEKLSQLPGSGETQQFDEQVEEKTGGRIKWWGDKSAPKPIENEIAMRQNTQQAFQKVFNTQTQSGSTSASLPKISISQPYQPRINPAEDGGRLNWWGDKSAPKPIEDELTVRRNTNEAFQKVFSSQTQSASAAAPLPNIAISPPYEPKTNPAEQQADRELAPLRQGKDNGDEKLSQLSGSGDAQQLVEQVEEKTGGRINWWGNKLATKPIENEIAMRQNTQQAFQKVFNTQTQSSSAPAPLRKISLSSPYEPNRNPAEEVLPQEKTGGRLNWWGKQPASKPIEDELAVRRNTNEAFQKIFNTQGQSAPASASLQKIAYEPKRNPVDEDNADDKISQLLDSGSGEPQELVNQVESLPQQKTGGRLNWWGQKSGPKPIEDELAIRQNTQQAFQKIFKTQAQSAPASASLQKINYEPKRNPAGQQVTQETTGGRLNWWGKQPASKPIEDELAVRRNTNEAFQKIFNTQTQSAPASASLPKIANEPKRNPAEQQAGSELVPLRQGKDNGDEKLSQRLDAGLGEAQKLDVQVEGLPQQKNGGRLNWWGQKSSPKPVEDELAMRQNTQQAFQKIFTTQKQSAPASASLPKISISPPYETKRNPAEEKRPGGPDLALQQRIIDEHLALFRDTKEYFKKINNNQESSAPAPKPLPNIAISPVYEPQRKNIEENTGDKIVQPSDSAPNEPQQLAQQFEVPQEKTGGRLNWWGKQPASKPIEDELAVRRNTNEAFQKIFKTQAQSAPAASSLPTIAYERPYQPKGNTAEQRVPQEKTGGRLNWWGQQPASKPIEDEQAVRRNTNEAFQKIFTAQAQSAPAPASLPKIAYESPYEPKRNPTEQQKTGERLNWWGKQPASKPIEDEQAVRRNTNEAFQKIFTAQAPKRNPAEQRVPQEKTGERLNWWGKQPASKPIEDEQAVRRNTNEAFQKIFTTQAQSAPAAASLPKIVYEPTINPAEQQAESEFAPRRQGKDDGDEKLSQLSVPGLEELEVLVDPIQQKTGERLNWWGKQPASNPNEDEQAVRRNTQEAYKKIFNAQTQSAPASASLPKIAYEPPYKPNKNPEEQQAARELAPLRQGKDNADEKLSQLSDSGLDELQVQVDPIQEKTGGRINWWGNQPASKPIEDELAVRRNTQEAYQKIFTTQAQSAPAPASKPKIVYESPYEPERNPREQDNSDDKFVQILDSAPDAPQQQAQQFEQVPQEKTKDQRFNWWGDKSGPKPIEDELTVRRNTQERYQKIFKTQTQSAPASASLQKIIYEPKRNPAEQVLPGEKTGERLNWWGKVPASKPIEDEPAVRRNTQEAYQKDNADEKLSQLSDSGLEELETFVDPIQVPQEKTGGRLNWWGDKSAPKPIEDDLTVRRKTQDTYKKIFTAQSQSAQGSASPPKIVYEPPDELERNPTEQQAASELAPRRQGQDNADEKLNQLSNSGLDELQELVDPIQEKTGGRLNWWGDKSAPKPIEDELTVRRNTQEAYQKIFTAQAQSAPTSASRQKIIYNPAYKPKRKPAEERLTGGPDLGLQQGIVENELAPLQSSQQYFQKVNINQESSAPKPLPNIAISPVYEPQRKNIENDSEDKIVQLSDSDPDEPQQQAQQFEQVPQEKTKDRRYNWWGDKSAPKPIEDELTVRRNTQERYQKIFKTQSQSAPASASLPKIIYDEPKRIRAEQVLPEEKTDGRLNWWGVNEGAPAPLSQPKISFEPLYKPKRKPAEEQAASELGPRRQGKDNAEEKLSQLSDSGLEELETFVDPIQYLPQEKTGGRIDWWGKQPASKPIEDEQTVRRNTQERYQKILTAQAQSSPASASRTKIIYNPPYQPKRKPAEEFPYVQQELSNRKPVNIPYRQETSFTLSNAPAPSAPKYAHLWATSSSKQQEQSNDDDLQYSVQMNNYQASSAPKPLPKIAISPVYKLNSKPLASQLTGGPDLGLQRELYNAPPAPTYQTVSGRMAKPSQAPRKPLLARFALNKSNRRPEEMVLMAQQMAPRPVVSGLGPAPQAQMSFTFIKEPQILQQTRLRQPQPPPSVQIHFIKQSQLEQSQPVPVQQFMLQEPQIQPFQQYREEQPLQQYREEQPLQQYQQPQNQIVTFQRTAKQAPRGRGVVLFKNPVKNAQREESLPQADVPAVKAKPASPEPLESAISKLPTKILGPTTNIWDQFSNGTKKVVTSPVGIKYAGWRDDYLIDRDEFLLDGHHMIHDTYVKKDLSNVKSEYRSDLNTFPVPHETANPSGGGIGQQSVSLLMPKAKKQPIAQTQYMDDERAKK